MAEGRDELEMKGTPDPSGRKVSSAGIFLIFLIFFFEINLSPFLRLAGASGRLRPAVCLLMQTEDCISKVIQQKINSSNLGCLREKMAAHLSISHIFNMLFTYL